MRILSIGNSFSDDATRYLAWLARADGVYLEVANLVIGGAPLSLHHQHMLDKEKAYFLCYNGIPTGFYVSLEEALSRGNDPISLNGFCRAAISVDYIPEHFFRRTVAGYLV